MEEKIHIIYKPVASARTCETNKLMRILRKFMTLRIFVRESWLTWITSIVVLRLIFEQKPTPKPKEVEK